MADRLANRLITEWGMCLTDTDFDGNERVNDYLYIICIVHEYERAYIYREGSISTFINAPITVEENMKDEFGYIRDRSIYIPTISYGEQNLAEAFRLAKRRVLEWKFAYINDIKDISPPIIFNVLCQSIPLGDLNRIEKAANRIKDVTFPDGSPLLFNIMIENRYKQCFFPRKLEDVGIINSESSLLLKISSIFDGQLKEINDEDHIMCAFAYWDTGRNIKCGTKLFLGGDENGIFRSIVEFPLWFHLRGLE